MKKLKICRICTKLVDSMGAKNIFGRTHKIILQHIKEITGIELEKSNNLPDLICKQCQLDLSQAYDFLKRVVNAQAFFEAGQHKNDSKEELSLQQSFNIKKEERQEPNPLEAMTPLASPSPSPLAEILQTIKYDDQQQFSDGEEAEQSSTKLVIDNNEQVLEVTSSDEFIPEIENSSDIMAGCEEVEVQVKKSTKSKKRIKQEEQAPRVFICELCGNNFKYRHHFRMHQRRHTGELRYQCELCPNKFLTSHQLKRHMRSHTGERPFACRHCGRCFADYSTRIKHERTHTNERPFACHQCNKAFTTSYILKNHLLIHTGERSFRCELCKKSFQRQTHLDTHYRSTFHQKLSAKQQAENQLTKIKTSEAR